MKVTYFSKKVEEHVSLPLHLTNKYADIIFQIVSVIADLPGISLDIYPEGSPFVNLTHYPSNAIERQPAALIYAGEISLYFPAMWMVHGNEINRGLKGTFFRALGVSYQEDQFKDEYVINPQN